MRISAFSVIIAFAALAAFGIFISPRLPLKLNPSRYLAEINISFSMRGQSAQIVEAEVTSKLEGMFGRIKGVNEIYSYSSNGSGRITIRLSKHADPAAVRLEISGVVRQAWASLPQGVSYPSIYMTGTSDETDRPFLRYTVNAPVSPIMIQQYINDRIKPKIAELKGIDKIEVFGAGRMIYKLEYDYRQLQILNISVSDIQSAIQLSLKQEFLGIGYELDENLNEQWIRLAIVSENRNQPFNPALIQVKNKDGAIIYLDRIVKTTCEEEEASSYFRINGLNSVYLSVTADRDANQWALGEQVQKLLAGYTRSLPAGYEMHLSYNAGEYIQKEMNKIGFRSGLTILILLCFVLLVYRNLKYLLLIVCSLAANIAIAVLFYYGLRIEMQLYSLAGLTISLSLIIDNTIVMSDQIIRRKNKKAFLAILAATLTSIGALSVIIFMDEHIRANMQDFAFVIIINLAVSLAVAWFLVPALIEKLKIEKQSSLFRIKYLNNKRLIVYFNRGYSAVIQFMSRRKIWFILLIIFAFGLPVFLLPDKIEENEKTNYWTKWYNNTLGSSFYKEKIKPVSDAVFGGTLRLFAQKVNNGSYSSGERNETTLNVTASLPNGATKEQMNNLIGKMENYLRQYSEIRQFETYIENGQRANITIFFVEKHQRSSFPYLLKGRLIGKATELGGGSWSVYGLGDGFSNDVKEQAGSCRIKLLGYNYSELQSLALQMKDSLLEHRRIKEVIIDSKFSWYKNDYTEFAFEPDREKLAQIRVLPGDLYQSVSPLFEKSVYAGDWIDGKGLSPILLFARQSGELDIWNMENYPGTTNNDNRSYKLSEIALIEKSTMPQDIAKENQQYLLCLQYEYIGAYQQAQKVADMIIRSFNRAAPLGYKAESAMGWYWHNRQEYKQYLLLLLIAAIIFFTTGVLFNSLTQPLSVIFIIPVSFIGLFLTFYLFKLNFDHGGFAAFILLSGITVNAGIYIFNEYNNICKRKKSISPLRAYIKAWNAKISPIFLTVISTILGFIPFMTGEYREAFWFSLAAGTIGGLIASLLGLFCFLPLFMGVGRGNR